MKLLTLSFLRRTRLHAVKGRGNQPWQEVRSVLEKKRQGV
jgi:hypothetical protein